jgi:hypothetical protein
MLMRFVGLAVVFLNCSWSSDPATFACAEKLSVPRYPELARQARLSGAVRLSLLRDGETVRVTTESTADKLLREAVEYIATSARMSRDCNRLTVEFVFAIDESKPRRKMDSGDVALEKPNRVLITASAFPLSGETGTK